jgi:hypothetical protein
MGQRQIEVLTNAETDLSAKFVTKQSVSPDGSVTMGAIS